MAAGVTRHRSAPITIPLIDYVWQVGLARDDEHACPVPGEPELVVTFSDAVCTSPPLQISLLVSELPEVREALEVVQHDCRVLSGPEGLGCEGVGWVAA